MPSIVITGIHCIEESTWGALARRRAARRRRESDEIAFIFAMLPIDTFGSTRWTDWTYADRERFFDARHVVDVDSDEAHAFRTPIRIEFQPPTEVVPNGLFELVAVMYEVDGSTETSSQATNMRNRLRDNLASKARPGLGLGSLPTARGNSARPSYDAHFEYAGDGLNDDMLLVDVWHLDPSNPMSAFDIPSVAGRGPGRQDPDIIVDQQQSNRRMEVSVSRFPPRPDRATERRQFTNRGERAMYHFDVHYLR